MRVTRVTVSLLPCDNGFFYSAAPLATDDHVAYLASIEETFLHSGIRKD